MGSGEKLTDRQRRTALRMHAEGISRAEIARHVEIHRDTVSQIIDQAARDYYRRSCNDSKWFRDTEPH